MSRDVYFYPHRKETVCPMVYKVRNETGDTYATYQYGTWNKLESLDHLRYIVEDHRHVEFKNTLKEENEDNG